MKIKKVSGYRMKYEIKAGIIGATGYAGVELVRLLNSHPYVKLESISSVSFHGRNINEIYPGLRGGLDMVLEENPESMMERCDVVFASLPHGLSQDLAKKCLDKNSTFIDLGADFRLESEGDYLEWYGGSFHDKDLHSEAVYGLCEVFREKIKGTNLIANPGCYPTSVALALYPALQAGLIDTKDIIIDSKSGITGAGRKVSQGTHFPECNEGFKAYKADGHRHMPEIEQTLSGFSGEPMEVIFTPHLLPVNRGILSTIYCNLRADRSEVRKCYERVYKNEPFIVVLEEGEYADIKNVRLSNACHISLHFEKRGGKLIICSAIDNMVKGAAGQAIQNMNIVFGFDERSGLVNIAPAF
jgi:N-acetyl-gamma-glutamyl-phosphate reductase